MKLTKELIKIINDNLGYLKKGLTLDYTEGDELKYFESDEVVYDRDPSEGTYTTRQEVIEHVTDEIIKLETVENSYILISEDSDYQLHDTKTVELAYYRYDGVEMIPDLESGIDDKFITLEEYLIN